jgi:hypothetical protein
MTQTLSYARHQTKEEMQWKITDGDTNLAIDLSGAVATFTIKTYTGTILLEAQAEIVEPATAGILQYKFLPGDLNMAKGTYNLVLKIIFGDTTEGIIGDMKIVIVEL